MSTQSHNDLLTNQDAWTSLLEMREQASKKQQYDRVIEVSNWAIQTFIDARLLNLYESRAMNYAKTDRFKEAVDDGKLMIELSPFQPQGYLCLCELYMMQCNTEEAVKVLKRGLSRILEASPEKISTFIAIEQLSETCKQLQSRLQAVGGQAIRRIDFITSTIPVEIVTNILSYLGCYTKDLFESLCVSKAWRTRILTTPETWSAVTMDLFEEHNFLQFLYILPTISKYVKAIEFSDMEKYERLFPYFAHSVRNSQFENLKNLKILAEGAGFNGQIFGTLKIIGSQLTNMQLRLYEGEDFPMLPDFFNILALCPNLQDFSYSGNGEFIVDDLDGMDEPFVTHDQLAELYISCLYLEPSALELILMRCPGINMLTVTANKTEEVVDNESGICSIVQRHSSQLRAFHYGNLDRITYKENIKMAREPSGMSSPGIRTFYMTDYQVISMVTLVPLLNGHRKTLKMITLHLPIKPTTFNQQTFNFHSLAFPVLQTLSLSNINFAYSESVIKIIQQSSASLEDLTLSFVDHSSVQYIFESLGKWIIEMALANQDINESSITLQRLVINTRCENNVSTDGGLRTLFKAFQKFGPLSPLRKITLSSIVLSHKSDVLGRLAGISTLRSIVLVNLKATTECFEDFTQKLKQQSESGGSLEELKMDGVECVTDGVFDLIGSIETLKRLFLYNLPKVTDHCLKYLNNGGPYGVQKLDYLEVMGCPWITEPGLRYINGVGKIITTANFL